MRRVCTCVQTDDCILAGLALHHSGAGVRAVCGLIAFPQSGRLLLIEIP
jgi:hypothetical protein